MFLFQDQVTNISVMLPALTTPLTMVIPQLAENAPLLSKAWTWHPYHLESVPGMMGQGPLSTEKWKPLGVFQRIEEAKVSGGQCPVLGAVDATACQEGCRGLWRPHLQVALSRECLFLLPLPGHRATLQSLGCGKAHVPQCGANAVCWGLLLSQLAFSLRIAR